MPKAYLVGHIDIHDAATYQDYVAQVPGVIRSFGGRYLVRGGDPETLEGTVPGSRSVVIEFPSRQAAETFYNSEAYAPVRAIRTGAADSALVLMDGIDEQPD